MLLLIGCERFAERRESLLFGYERFAERKALLLIGDEKATERKALLLINEETPTGHGVLLLTHCESLADCKACLSLTKQLACFCLFVHPSQKNLYFLSSFYCFLVKTGGEVRIFV